MVALSKYSEKEVVAAVRAVEEIVDMEDFGLFVDEDDGELCFALEDHQGANLGDIESDRFDSLGGIINRMEIYHNDYFYNDYEERVAKGEEIPQDDWDRKVLIFLENDYCCDLLMDIDVETYQKYKDVKLDEIGLNSGEIERYVENGKFDAIGYVIDKAIAMKIMGTQSGYPMAEFDNSIYVAAHCDWYDNAQQMLDELKNGENCFCNNYCTYGSLIETEQYQVKDDMHDIGLYDDKDNWQFYLSEYELEYVGLADELKAFKKDFEAIVEDAKNRADKSDIVAGKDEVEIEKE